MRALIVIVVLVLVFALLGWITFNKGPDRASINIEAGQIREDTKQAMQSGAELLHRAGDKVQGEAERQPETADTNRQTEPITR